MADTPQASGGDGRKGAPDGTNLTSGTGESGGGARPGQEEGGNGGAGTGFLDHGGQSEIGYHGPEQLGGKIVKGGPNENAGTERG